MSRFDQIYRGMLLTKFFTKGWGKPDNLKRLFEFRKVISNRDVCKHLVDDTYPVHIEKDMTYSDCRIMEGHFLSPIATHLPDIVPTEVKTARFQVILPTDWNRTKPFKPVCVHLAGTGDHGYWRRRALMARPLIKKSGIASIILENPYYGSRKPKKQLRSSLQNVSDLFVMGSALILESLVLFHWCEKQGLGPLGISGISLGGHMASLAATNWHKPISLIPCLSWSTGSCAFTQGVLSGTIPWNLLQNQYFEDNVYEQEIQNLLHSPEKMYKGAYPLGQQFVKDIPESINRFDELSEHYRLRGQDVIINGHNGKSRNTETAQSVSMETGSKSNQSESLSVQFSSSKSKLSVPQWAKHTLEKVKMPVFTSSKGLSQESVEFMRGVMDECTHLGNFSVPLDSKLIIVVLAKKDAYIPREGVLSLDELWPGIEIRYIDAGHVAACLLNFDVFRTAITDSFNLQIERHYS